MNNQQLVREFQLTAGQNVNSVPTPLTKKSYEFRKSLNIEELDETEKAIKDNDTIEQADGICDMLYVVNGAANELGLDHSDDIKRFEIDYDKPHQYTINGYILRLRYEIYNNTDLSIDTEKALHLIYRLANKLGFSIDQVNGCFLRVHKSNMSKFCKSYADADKTVAKYADDGVEAYYIQNGGYYVILRKSDNKVLKAWDYHRVDLTDLVS